MKLKPALLWFYLSVSLFVLVDGAIIIAMVWNSLKVADSALLMGTTLCVATILPYGIERLFGAARLFRRSVMRLAVIRLVALSCIALLAAAGCASHAVGFVAMAFIVGVVDFFTISTLEAKNAKLVLDGHIDSDRSARMMQTAIQVGAFSGAFIGGSIVDHFEVRMALMTIAAIGIASLALSTLIVGITGDAQPSTPPAARKPASPVPLDSVVKYVIAALAMVGFHIGAFNSLIPVIFQKLNGWDATQFGLVGGMAGLGAFLGAFLPRIAKSDYPYLALIVVADAVIVFSPWQAAIFPLAFVLGFSMNQVRIGLRKMLIELAQDEAMANAIAARSTFYYLLMAGLAPFTLTSMTTNALFGMAAAKPLMVGTALVLAAAVLVLISRPKPVAATSTP